MSSYFNNNYELNDIFKSIKLIRGVGPKLYSLIENKIGNRIIDLLLYVPYRSINRYNSSSLKTAIEGEIITVEVEVIETTIKKSYFKKKIPSKIITFGTKKDKNQRLDIVYFNLYTNQLNQIFKIGKKYVVSGKLEIYQGIYQITHPDYVFPSEKKHLIPEFDPVYKLFLGITKRKLVDFIQSSIKTFPDISEWISNDTLNKLKFLSLKETIVRIHNPKYENDHQPDTPLIQRLAFDELLANYITINILKDKIKSDKSNIISDTSTDKDFIKNLPFALTNDQTKAIQEIKNDLINNKPMMRLLQGDVGCGKTIVALISMIKVIASGFQAALMVPTEVLAKQHYETIKVFLKEINIKPVLILGQGRIKKHELEEIKNNVEKGFSKLIIGTHSLISEGIKYHNLKLAIIDEQHRFGVNQRIAMAEKGQDVNILVMTATPIPRSLALTSYGEMSITNLKEKPSGRIKIETSMVSSKKINQLIEGLKRRVSNNSLIYWICPSIEESEENNLISIEERYKILKQKLPNIEISIAHGKQEINERNSSIQKFKNSTSKILLATTVVEVGIDIPDADIIVIECSNRYGLAQLHQLRGRVGRGNRKSYCILLYENNLSNIAEQRLKTLKNHDDGFLIAEEDLVLRGPGEILGTKQSGQNSFKFVNFQFHDHLIEIAKSEAFKLYNEKNNKKREINILLKTFQNSKFINNIGG